MTELELKQVVAGILEIDVPKLEKTSQTDWDSLAHLSILMALEAKAPGKIGNIPGIGECFTYEKLVAKLEECGLLK